MLSWYRDYADSSAVSNTLLLVLHIQHVILVSRLCWFKRSPFINSRNCLATTNVVRRVITSIGCRPWSRELLCFKKRTDGHFIFCRWLSFITVFAVPLCSPRWIQQSIGARLNFSERFVHSWFRTTIRGVLALTAISSCHSLDYITVGAFISSILAYSEHLYKKASAGYDHDWGTASPCKSSDQLVQVSRQFYFFHREVFGLALVLGFGLMPVRWTSQVNSHPNVADDFAISLAMDFSHRVYKSYCHYVGVTILVMYVDNHGIQHNCEDLVQWFEKFVVLTMNPGRRRLGLSAHPWQSR